LQQLRGITNRWKETAQLLDAERPDLEAELARIERDLVTAATARDKYFASFEAGTLSAADCGPRLEEIGARLRTLQTRKVELEEARTRLALPALDRAAVAALMDDFEAVFDSGTNAQKKNLVHMLVKEVRVHSRDEAEVWFTFPRPQEPDGNDVAGSKKKAGAPSGAPVRTLTDMAPQIGQCTNRGSPWEYAVVVRVMVRMPCDADFPAAAAPIPLLGSGRDHEGSSAPAGGAGRRHLTPGHPVVSPPRPERQKLGPSKEPSFFLSWRVP
jgi:hypothetical protein